MIDNDWDEKLKVVWESPGFKKFMEKIEHEYKTKTCYPAFENIFSALKMTPYEKVKVVIIGQDPYHGEGQAHGLSFSVQKGIAKPPSLQNIFKELKDDLLFINERADNLADRLENVISAGRTIKPETLKHQQANTDTEDARSEAELELLKALRSIK